MATEQDMSSPTKEDLIRLDNKGRKVRRIAANAVSMLASNVTNRIAAFVVYALTARFLGTLEFGQMSLGLTLFHTFQMLAVAGLKTLIMREVAKDQDKSKLFLVNASAVVTLTSLLAILAMNCFTIMMDYAESTRAVIFILSLGILPYSLSMICDALFQGREKMHFIAYSNLLFSVIKIGLVVILLVQGLSIYQLAWLITLTYGVGTMIKLWFLIIDMGAPELRVDPKFCVVMAKSTVTFLGINCVSAVMVSFNTILLSKFSSEIEVGFYNAATQLLIPVMLLFNSVVLSVYPVLCRSFESGMRKLQTQSEQLLEIIWTIVLPTVVALYFLGETLLITIYGKSTFAQSALVLQIIIWALILTSTAKVFGLVLVASMNEKKTLQILVIDLISLVVLGMLLVSQFGLIGSAVTMLLVRIVDFVQHYIPVSRLFTNFSIEKIIWRPVLASATMAIAFFALKELNIWVAASAASFIYIVVFLLILLLTAGGIKQFMINYSYIWSKQYQDIQDVQND